MASPVGERIRLRRQALGLSQKELGERVGASASSVIAWEKGRWFPGRKQGAVEAVLGISLAEEVDPREEAMREVTKILSPEERELWLTALRMVLDGEAAPPGEKAS